MKSVSLVEYKQGKNGLPDFMKEIARHYQTLWSTAVSPIGDNKWLESDAEGNLVVLQRNVNGVTDDDRRRLNVISEMLLGEMTNRIRPVNIHTPPSSTVIPKAFLATVSSFLCYSKIYAYVRNRWRVRFTYLVKLMMLIKTFSCVSKLV